VNRTSKFIFTISFGTALTLMTVAAQQTVPASEAGNTGKSSAGMAANDTTFLKRAASGGMAEVELGQLAVQKASSAVVKQFGQRMMDDHTKANQQLKKIAAQERVTLPSGMNATDKALKSSLESLSGEDFDREYMKDMVKDHSHDVAEFEQQSKSAHDPAVKNFAAQALPTLRDHLQEAQRIASTIQSAKNAGQ
jgi:putative membrane protein